MKVNPSPPRPRADEPPHRRRLREQACVVTKWVHCGTFVRAARALRWQPGKSFGAIVTQFGSASSAASFGLQIRFLQRPVASAFCLAVSAWAPPTMQAAAQHKQMPDQVWPWASVKNTLVDHVWISRRFRTVEEANRDGPSTCSK